MWFKNLTVYRMPVGFPATVNTDLEDALSANARMPLSPGQSSGQGWSPVYDGQFVHTVNHQMLMLFTADKKTLPSSLVKSKVDEQVREISDMQGRKVGKKQRKEIVEDVITSLLPMALPTTSHTQVWIDPVNGWIVVNTSSKSRADAVITVLVKSIDKLSLETLHLAHSPTDIMTSWLRDDESPFGFTVDREAELVSTDEMKAKVRYTNSSLDTDDLKAHIKSGKRCTKLALTWSDRISFVMTDSCIIKKVTALDLLSENAEVGAVDDRERFDVDFALMTGEVNRMLSDLLQALGGEAPRTPPADEMFKRSAPAPSGVGLRNSL